MAINCEAMQSKGATSLSSVLNLEEYRVIP
jgi:hypothetical protein